MNILAISSIFPIPNYINTNDFLIHFYKTYLKEYPDSKITVMSPVRFSLFTKKIKKMHQIREFDVDIFKVYIIKFFSLQRFFNIHSIINKSIYFLNKKKIKQILKDGNYDLCHAQYLYPDGRLAQQLKKHFNLPYVITTHNELRFFTKSISAKIARSILNNASYITPLNYNSDVFYKKNNIRNSFVIPLGIYNSLLDYKKDYYKKEIVKIISICALIKLKNIDKVIKALSKIDQNKYEYTIVGKGKERENLQKLVQNLNLQNNVFFIESIPHDEIGEIISNHDIFIMPSYYETFGRVYIEAMAIGLPIICSKNSGIFGYYKELEEGISVDHTNVNEIRDKLELLISDHNLRKKIGRNGKNLVKEFTWEKIAFKYNDLFKKTLA